MLAVRIAETDPSKQQERATWLAAHQAYLRGGGIRIVQSGPLFEGERQFGALLVAEVDDLEDLVRFSVGDPFVIYGIYRDNPRILKWTRTIG